MIMAYILKIYHFLAVKDLLGVVLSLAFLVAVRLF